MAEEHQLPDTECVERQAAQWVARLNADDVSDEDRAHFDAWRQAHPLHARAYDAMRDTWQQFTSAGPLVRAVAFGESMNEAAHQGRLMRRTLDALLYLLHRRRPR